MILRETKSTDFEVFAPAYHDILEAEAMGITPSYPPASECLTIDHEGFPLAIGGNCGDQCWFITSAQLWRLDKSHKLEFIKIIKQHRDDLLSQYDSLWNYVWVGNVAHIRFLKSIGAVFHNEYTRDGTFQLFTITGGA